MDKSLTVSRPFIVTSLLIVVLILACECQALHSCDTQAAAVTVVNAETLAAWSPAPTFSFLGTLGAAGSDASAAETATAAALAGHPASTLAPATEKPMELVMTKTLSITTPTVQMPPAQTPTSQSGGCIAPATLIDPFSSNPAVTTSMALAWDTNYALKPGEAFDVLVSPSANDLINLRINTNPKLRIGTTTQKTLPIDLTKWAYAGTFGQFYWAVRIVSRDGTYLDCTAPPATFTLAEREQPHEPPAREAPGGGPIFHR